MLTENNWRLSWEATIREGYCDDSMLIKIVLATYGRHNETLMTIDYVPIITAINRKLKGAVHSSLSRYDFSITCFVMFLMK